MKWMRFGALSLFLLVSDICIKYYTVMHIPTMSWMHPFYPYGGIAVFKDFFGVSLSLNKVENLGAAWGLFAAYSDYLFYLRILVVIGLMVYLFLNKNSWKAFPLMLIITGAIGNILDFVFYKHVIDMFHFNFFGYSYPVFNLADAMITVGIMLLIVFSFFGKKS